MQSHYVVFPSPWLRVEINYPPSPRTPPIFVKDDWQASKLSTILTGFLWLCFKKISNLFQLKGRENDHSLLLKATKQLLSYVPVSKRFRNLGFQFAH